MVPSSPPSSFDQLTNRLNLFPQGAPPSESLSQILGVLFSPREAELVAALPIKPFKADTAARLWKLPLPEARRVLDGLASRALLIDTERDGEVTYTLPPPMAGFFEFSMMRLRDDVDQKLLGELYYQYVTVESEFMRSLYNPGGVQMGRVFVHEPALPETHVLDYERASEVIRTATHRGISLCYCREKMSLMQRACNAPLEICMTFNTTAESLARHGYARSVDVVEGLDLLQKAYECNLVQFGENARQGVSFICNCCGCCCEAMIAARRFTAKRPVHTTNFMPVVNEEKCTGCGKCVNVCPVEAMGLVSANQPLQHSRRKAHVDEDLCLGCGVCTRVCPNHGISLKPRTERVITPLNSVHRVVLMAIDKGQLQNLIFDQQVLWSQRTLSLVLGAILSLPPIKRAMASKQLRSRYLEALMTRLGI